MDVDPGATGCALSNQLLRRYTSDDRDHSAGRELYEPISQEHGAAACLGKPITIAKLKSTLDKVLASWALTSDRWGSLVPRPTEKTARVEARFRGIAAKLSPSGRRTEKIREGHPLMKLANATLGEREDATVAPAAGLHVLDFVM